MDYVGGVSLRDRAFFRLDIRDCMGMSRIPLATASEIGACEMLAASVSIIIIIWITRNERRLNIILRTGNSIVPHWMSKMKAKSGLSNRILKMIIDYLIDQCIDVVSRYFAVRLIFRPTARQGGKIKKRWTGYTKNVRRAMMALLTGPMHCLLFLTLLIVGHQC